jgi:choice-of-anchor A domain-containing protein
MKIAFSDTICVVLSNLRKRKTSTKKIRKLKLAFIIVLLSINQFYCFSSLQTSKVGFNKKTDFHFYNSDSLTYYKTSTLENTDTDGDGIPDILDLDDDNDGVLDIDEGFKDLFSIRNEGVIITINGAWILNPTSVYVDLPSNLSHGDEFWVPFLGGSYVKAVKLKFENTENGIRFSQTAAKHTVGNDPELDINLDYDFDNNGIIAPIAISDTSEGYGVSTVEYKDKIIIATYLGETGKEWVLTELDTDNDGIIDSRDTDSDNDDCPDASEASNNLTTTATLENGSNGGSSDNLGVISNNFGIPLPLGTINGNETVGQSNSITSIHSERLTVLPLSDIIADAGDNISISVSATAIKTETFNLGVPNYTSAYGIDSSDEITYKWYRSSDLNTVISTSSTLILNSINYTNSGTYIVEIKGIMNSCVVYEPVNITIETTDNYYYPIVSAQCFNVFIENNTSVIAGSTNGSLASGGDLSIIGNYSVASQNLDCFNYEGNEIGLLVDGKINYGDNSVLSIPKTNQYIKIGNSNSSVAWYKDFSNSTTSIRITPDANYNSSSYIQLSGDSNSLNVSNDNNPIFEKNIIDFTSAFQSLKTNSSSLSHNANNTLLKDNEGTSIANTDLPNDVKIELQNGTNYLNITGIDLDNVNTLTFTEQPSASKVLIINVDAVGIFNWNVWEQKNIGLTESPYIIYNFYNTTELNIIGNQEIRGTLLAPFADIIKSVNKENIFGQVIGKSLEHNGGEIQFATFNSPVVSLLPSGVSPTAEFTVNDHECLESNEFIFNNTSNTGTAVQPTDPISYSWDFGDGTSSSYTNPTKTYAVPGIYNVILTATNTFGSNSEAINITVLAVPDQPVLTKAGESTSEFTLENDTYFDSFYWELEGVGTNLFPNQKTVSFNFKTEGVYLLTLTGIKDGCSQAGELSIVIASEEVTSGNKGGVESESLGDAISKIYVNRKKSSVPTEFKKSAKNLYHKEKLKREQPYQGKGQTLLSMFPSELVVGNIANVSSPTDILDYTMADEVLSVDFSVDGKTKGVVLGIKTSDAIYNHTKASCDRLKGAEILNIQTVVIDGYKLLIQAVQQRNGVVEYAISFAAAKNINDDEYTLQTNWNVSEYIKFNEVYNFQAWSTNPDDTKKLVSDVLGNLKGYIPVNQTEIQKVPKTFAAKISRDKSDLVIKLKSIEKGLNTDVFIEEVYTETTNSVSQRYNPLNTELEQTITIDIKDGYEYNGLVTVNDDLQDAFYHADGNWGLYYDSQVTQVDEYVVSNNFERAYNDDEHEISRTVTIKAISEFDDLGIYKSLLPGNLSSDFSEYKYFVFTAKGSGLIELGLLKSSIEEWKEQYRFMVNLSEEEQTYYIPFDYFSSTGTTDKIIADDLTTIAFTFLPIEANTKELDLTVSDLKFVKTATDDQILGGIENFKLVDNNFIAYPNPSKGNVNLLLFSNIVSDATISLIDVTGKEIYSSPLKLMVGKNEFDFNIKVKPGILFLKIRSKNRNYGTSKIIFK